MRKWVDEYRYHQQEYGTKFNDLHSCSINGIMKDMNVIAAEDFFFCHFFKGETFSFVPKEKVILSPSKRKAIIKSDLKYQRIMSGNTIFICIPQGK